MNAIKMPGSGYDEQRRILRTIEELQPDHLRILRAMLQEPVGPETGSTGSPGATLVRRLPDIARDHLMELAVQLTDELHVTTIGKSLNTMSSWRGAEDLRGHFTPYGQRLVVYIRAANDEPSHK